MSSSYLKKNRKPTKGQAQIFKTFEKAVEEGTVRVTTTPEIEKMLENPCKEVPLGPSHRSEVKAPEDKKQEVFAVMQVTNTASMFLGGGQSEVLLTVTSTLEGARKAVNIEVTQRLSQWDGKHNLFLPAFLVRRKVLTE